MGQGGIERVAVIGAGGTMGRGIARNLAAAGVMVNAWNRSSGKLPDLADVSRIAPLEDLTEAVAGADAVLTMVTDADSVLSVMDEAAGSIAAGAIWLQMSTIGIAGIERCASLADRAGLTLVDAPVLGTKQPAEAGELIILAAGPDNARTVVEPVFDAIGKRTLWVGEAGAASRLKVAINSWIVTVVEGTAETLALAEGLDVDPERVLDAISGGPLDLPYMRIKAAAMLDREFAPSFRLALAAKDATLAVDGAREAGIELPMVEAIAARMGIAAKEHGDKDIAATYLASTPVVSQP
jgi:3-hydroxyisobutyrate dehydrogenase